MATPLSPKLPWESMNPILAQVLNPFIANPANSIQIINNLSLVAGENIINHRLGRTLQGWFFTDIQGVATYYRSKPFNNLTLTLTMSAPVIVNLGVF